MNKKWSKDDALAYLDSLISETSKLEHCKRHSSEHIRWLTNALVFLEEVFGESSYYYVNIRNLSWQFSGSRIISGWDINEQIEEQHQEAYVEQLDSARGFLFAAKDYLTVKGIENVYKSSVEIQATGELIKILSLSENKLRKTIRTTPSKEKEIQDSYENLLIGADIEYRREFPHIEYSSKTYIPDFSFDHISLVVEVKLCKSDEKALIQQLNDDILAYKTKYSNVLFIIYDLSVVRDVDKFKESFEKFENVIVQIVKH